MPEPMVMTERRGRVLEITMNRAPVNAINRQISRELYQALKTLQDDPALSVGIISGGEQRVFSAGWDLKETAADGIDPAADYHPETGYGPGGFAGITEYWDLRKPVIAAVTAPAIGGGFEIVIACDLIVMAEDAYFALPEMQRGILADGGAVQRLPHLVPPYIARDWLLTGRRFDAAESARWGLVNRVVPKAEVVAEARRLAEEISQGAPLALQALKEVLLYMDGMPLPEAMAKIRPGGDSGLPIYSKLHASEDAIEGIKAFAEKRDPNWKGR